MQHDVIGRPVRIVSLGFNNRIVEEIARVMDHEGELVAWPSAYSAGTSLAAHAINHHYYIVSSTLVGDCSVFDITGRALPGPVSENSRPVIRWRSFVTMSGAVPRRLTKEGVMESKLIFDDILYKSVVFVYHVFKGSGMAG